MSHRRGTGGGCTAMARQEETDDGGMGLDTADHCELASSSVERLPSWVSVFPQVLCPTMSLL